MAHMPDRVLALAARQLGIVTRAEVIGLGVTPGQINGWLERGSLERVHRNVYRLAGAPITRRATHYAAVRRGGPTGRGGGASALGFMQVDGFDLRDDPFVVIAEGHRLVNVPFLWLSAPVPKCDAAILPDGVPGVTPARALIEAAGVVDRRRVRVGYDDLRRRGLIKQARLIERALELRGIVPGADTALDIAAGGDLDKDSEGERALATVFLATDPLPLWQVWVLDDVRVDALYPEARLVLEYHGRKHHTIDVDVRSDDARAARLARERDLEVLVVWHEDLADRGALRERILGRRAERIRVGIAPLRDFRLDRR